MNRTSASRKPWPTRLAWNTLWLFLDRGAFKVASIIAGFALLRYLGPTDYGSYAVALSSGALLATLSDFGLSRFASWALAADPECGGDILSSVATLSGAAILLQLGVLLVTDPHKHFVLCLTVAGMLAASLDAVSATCAAMLNAELRSAAVLPGSLLNVLGNVVVILLVLTSHANILPLLLGMAAKSACVMCLRCYQVRHFWLARQRLSIERMSCTIRASWSFFCVVLAEMVYTQGPVLALGAIADRKTVGCFAAAMAIVGVLPQWIYAAFDAVQPVITRIHNAGQVPVVQHLSHAGCAAVVGITTFVAVALSALAGPVCELLGPAYRDSVTVLRVAAFNIVPICLWGFLGSVVLTALDRVDLRKAGLALSVCVSVVLLPVGAYFGAVGAAAALVLTNAATVEFYRRSCVNAGLRMRLISLHPFAELYHFITTSRKTMVVQGL